MSREYGDDADIRRVRQNGQIKWRGELVFISQALIGEPIALTPTDLDGRWVISYGPVALGVIDAAGKLHRLHPQPQPNPRG